MVPAPPLFPELTPQSLHVISACGVTRSYRKNCILVSEGDQGDSLYIILSGKVKIFATDENGKEVLLNVLGPGEYFGELSLIDSEPRSASVLTIEPAQISVVSRADFRRCLATHPEIAFDLIRALVKRVRALTVSVKNLALLDVYGRVAHTLLNLATERDGILVIEDRWTYQDIANMVGASREMVSRIIKDLTIGGYIEVKDRKITIRGKVPLRW